MAYSRGSLFLGALGLFGSALTGACGGTAAIDEEIAHDQSAVFSPTIATFDMNQPNRCEENHESGAIYSVPDYLGGGDGSSYVGTWAPSGRGTGCRFGATENSRQFLQLGGIPVVVPMQGLARPMEFAIDMEIKARSLRGTQTIATLPNLWWLGLTHGHIQFTVFLENGQRRDVHAPFSAVGRWTRVTATYSQGKASISFHGGFASADASGCLGRGPVGPNILLGSSEGPKADDAGTQPFSGAFIGGIDNLVFKDTSADVPYTCN